jgi:hypothetical protein
MTNSERAREILCSADPMAWCYDLSVGLRRGIHSAITQALTEAEARGARAERERCAKVAEGVDEMNQWGNRKFGCEVRAEIAQAIREQEIAQAIREQAKPCPHGAPTWDCERCMTAL